MHYIKHTFLILVSAVALISCDNPVTPGTTEFIHHTSNGMYFAIPPDSLHPAVVKTIFTNMSTDTLRVVPSRYFPLQIWIVGEWVDIYVPQREYHSTESIVLPNSSIRPQFEIRPEDPLLQGLYRLSLKYSRGSSPRLYDSYTNNFWILGPKNLE